MSTEETLTARRKTHGDFADHARISQSLKDVMRFEPGWEKLTAMQRESLEMNQHKVARILAGNPDEPDHWFDIAGYATLVHQRLA
jgi:hypothetical protein